MVLKVEADTLSGRIPIGPWIGQGYVSFVVIYINFILGFCLARVVFMRQLCLQTTCVFK